MASITLTRFFIIFTSLPLITHSIPFIVFHGVADSCTKKGVTHFTDLLSEWSNTQGYCIEIGNGVWDSWFMSFEDQVEIACEKVKNMSELSQGYNIVGLSQDDIIKKLWMISSRSYVARDYGWETMKDQIFVFLYNC